MLRLYMGILQLTQASNLSNFAKGAKLAGGNMLVFDFGVGVSKTYVDYQKGGNWHKTMFVESIRLGSTAAFAGITSTIGTALFLSLTPVGWVVVVGVTAALGYGAITAVHENSDKWYDSIMEWIN
jgi:hypothetical protein